VQSLFHLLSDNRLNHPCQVVPGILAEQCGEILSRFFQEQRRLGKK
jgi:tRNA(adenine34) deaminase